MNVKKRMSWRSICVGLVALLFGASANAGPIAWSLEGDLSGGFEYDAAQVGVAGYSAISVSSPFATYTNAYDGDASSLNLFFGDALAGLFLDIAFSSPLTNDGGTVSYEAVGGAYALSGLVRLALTSYQGDDNTAIAVPEPGTLGLLGGSLLLLVWLARRRLSF